MSIGAIASCLGGGVLDLLAPARCAGCRCDIDVVRGVCGSCRSQLRSSSPSAWWIGAAGWAGTGGLSVAAAAIYEGSTRAMLLAYKERGQYGLRHELGGALFVACLAALGPRTAQLSSGPLCLVPVPSRRATVRARGHDAVRGLAAAAVRELRHVRLRARVTPALRHTRLVADQAGLNVVARSENLAGALAVRRPGSMKGRRVLVVDDIVTTGATAGEAARALEAAGAVVLGVAAVAFTPRRRGA